MSDAKREAAQLATEFLRDGMIVGVGTGSTVAYFIEALSSWRGRILGAVSSSNQSTVRLQQLGIAVLDLNDTGPLPLYVDGADECTPEKKLIKGGGGALTREKILAQASQQFVCIIDAHKQVEQLGHFPLPVEVIPMARRQVAEQIADQFGGQPRWRKGVWTDNGNLLLDIHGLQITNPDLLEAELNQLPGVVTVGLFARRPADVVIVGKSSA